MSDLKIGDRVIVEISPRKTFHGTIIGEGRTGEWWQVLKDERKHAQGISKAFCRHEEPRND